MKVGIELFKGKLLANGNYPIAIRLTNNGKTKYQMTGVSCKLKNWNNTKKCITCRETDFRLKNEVISHKYNEILSRANWFISNGYELDFQYIFSNKSLTSYKINEESNHNYNFNNFIDIIKARIDSVQRVKTKQNYTLFLKLMVKMYGEFIDTRIVNQMFALQFRIRLQDENYTPSHMNAHITRFLSCYKFGVENRMITHPYTITLKKYPYIPKKVNLTNEEVTNIINIYKKQIQANFPFNEIESLSLFCLTIAFQGLAPIDLANLKIGDLNLCKIRLIDIDTEKYNNDISYREYVEQNQKERWVIKINTMRTKTNTYVPICTDFNTIKSILYNLCKSKTKDDYLLNCFYKEKNYTEKQYLVRCSHFFCNHSAKLNKFLSNENIKTKVTFYSARHAFINILDKLNISHDLIRKMVGHKSNALEKHYINKPTDFEQSEIIFQIFNNVDTIENIEKQIKGDDIYYKELKELKLFLLNDISY